MAINVNTYTKHTWVDDSSPDLDAENLNEIETGIKDNNDAIKAIAAAVVSQIVNDPDKIASMAALYAVNQTLGTLSTTVTNINSNLNDKANASDLANYLLKSNIVFEGATKLRFGASTDYMNIDLYSGMNTFYRLSLDNSNKTISFSVFDGTNLTTLFSK